MTFSMEARNIRKSFGGVEVLHGVDLHAVGGSVLALLGENGAGKSTLVRIIAGDHMPDGGEVVVDGVVHSGLNSIRARELGVAMIFQEVQDAPTLSVAENIALGRLPNRRGFVDWNDVHRRAEAVLQKLEVDIDPNATVGQLRVGERQIVEIARSLSGNARLLILDEPTAALSHHETELLFAFVRRLRAEGVAIIYITHRLDEVSEIADRVQVLRDGSTTLLGDVASTDRRSMIEAMIGRPLANTARPATAARSAGVNPAIRWSSASLDRSFTNVSAEVYPGEVVALFGKLGSGAAEVGETAYGLHHLDAGRLEIEGRPATLNSPAAATHRGVGFLPAERKAGGAFLVRSVAENIAVSSWPLLAKFRLFITSSTEARSYRHWQEKLSIRSRSGPRQLMSTLSGGNQQKALIARWLERGSKVLIFLEPTRGVDVGARLEIYRALRELAATGVAILLITSDYEEVVDVADRCYVMAKGRIVAELSSDTITAGRLLEASGG